MTVYVGSPTMQRQRKKMRAASRYFARCARNMRVTKKPKVRKPLNEREKIQFKEPSPTLAWEIMTGFRG